MNPDRQFDEKLSQLLRTKQYVRAREALEKEMENGAHLEFRLLRIYADLLLKLGDTYKAGPVIAELMAEHPDHPQVLSLAADRHRLEGRTEQATAIYLEALKGHDNLYVRTRAIDGLLALERFPEAENLIEEGLDTSPNDPYLLRRKARLLAATSRKDEAVSLYTQVSASASSADGRDYVEALKLKLREIPPAEQRQEVEQLLAIESHSKNPHLLVFVAELCIDQEDRGKARVFLDEAASLAEGNPFANKSIGFQFNRLEAYERVLDTLGQAYLHDPRDIVSQQVLLAAARKSGNLPRLRTLFVLAYERHPGFHKLNGLIKKIDKELANKDQNKENST